MKKSDFRQGFTIVELMTVMVIIMILAGITVTGVRAAIESSRKRATEIMIACLGTAISMYHTELGSYAPDTSNKDMVTALENGDYIEFKSSDLDGSGQVVDPWDTPYNYLIMDDYMGTKWGNTKSFNLWSEGPDGTDDSYDGGSPDSDYGDDIYNW